MHSVGAELVSLSDFCFFYAWTVDVMTDVSIVMGILMQNHKCNEVENAFPIFKVSRLVRVHTDSHHNGHNKIIFSERELMFMFAICRRPSVCLSVCRLSVTFVHPTQPIEIFVNVSAPCNTLVTWRHPGKILRRSSQGNPSFGGLNQRVLEKMYRFWTFARLYLGNGAR